jgi:cobalt-zinc-cadmium efflux system protein
MGYDLLKASTKVLMLFTPETIKVEEIARVLGTIPPIKNIHHVHIWQLNEQEIHLEAHVDFNENISLEEFDKVLDEIEEKAYHHFGINHVNIQPEYGKCDSDQIIVQD